MSNHVGRLLRAPLHFTRNVVVQFFKKDLRRFLFRHNGHPVRLLLFKCLETVWVAGRVVAVLALGAVILAVGLLAAAAGYAVMELLQVWLPIDKHEEFDASSTAWR